MDEQFVDLHTHSLASDGTDTPTELAKKAAESGVVTFAITDHDTVAGVAEAQYAAKQCGIECIAGCEIAVHEEHLEEVHILGLWVDWEKPALLDFLELQKHNRFKRNQYIIKKLQLLGFAISLEEVMELSGTGTCGRPHIARTMVSKGYVADVRTAFSRYLGARGNAYIPRVLSSPEQGIGALAASGATVILAHPCSSNKMTPKRLDALLKKYIPYGLHGIEAFHSVHATFKQRLCQRMAGKHNLLISGGSDYHGAVKNYAHLGFAKYGQRIPYRYLERMKLWREKRGLPL